MRLGKNVILGIVCALILGPSALGRKSVFIISRHDIPSHAQAYSIEGTQVVYQGDVNIDSYNPGIGAAGNSVWPEKELMFVTYEDSGMIVWSSTKTLEKAGEFQTGLGNLAGIVVDIDKEFIYVMERDSVNLHLYSFDETNNILDLEGTWQLNPTPGYYINGMGLALDETNHLLYVTSLYSNRVHIYDTDDFIGSGGYVDPSGYIDIVVGVTTRQAVGIGVDPVRRFMYTAGFYGTGAYHNCLVRTQLDPPYTSIETDIGDPFIGIDVDKTTGLVYCTTHAYYYPYTSDFRVYNSSLTLLDIERNDYIESPAGVAVGGWYKTDNFNLTKDDGGVVCLSPDQQFTYYIHYNANDADTSVVVTDTLPNEVDYISSIPEGQRDGRIVTWTFPFIEAGQQGTLQILVKLNCYAKPGSTITNVVEMEGVNYYSKATLGTQVCCGGEIIYVDKDATMGCNNGTSWDNAYIDLQDALQGARAGCGSEIWVAEGTYKPTTNPSDSGATFELIDGVDMYGHFGGIGTYEDSPDDRNFDNSANKTTLDGQIGVNPSDAVQHVVTAKNIGYSEDTIVDGFTITGSYNGAGLLINNCPNSKLKIIKCNIEDNDLYGIYSIAPDGSTWHFELQDCVVMSNSLYGIYCERSWPLIVGTIFDGGNQSQSGISASMSAVDIYDSEVKNHTGSGIYAGSNTNLLAEDCSVIENALAGIKAWDSQQVTIKRCIINNNNETGVLCQWFCNVEITQSKIYANKYAGIYLEDSLGTTITNNWICDNLRVDPYDYAGIYLNGPISPALIRNNTVCKNEPYGIYLTSGGTEPEVVNCILYYNTTTQIYTGSGQPPLQYVSYSCIQGDLYPGYGNINTPPLFVNAAIGNYHLTKYSECVDKGNSSSIPLEENDIDGNPRVAGTDVDIGGDEDFKHCFPKYEYIYDNWVVPLGRPKCWLERYQCDGDADNAIQGLQKYRVYTNDYNIMVANWKKLINDPTLNPCADFDQKPQGLPKYRVYTNDFNILVGNWKKTDIELPGDCYKCERYEQSQEKTLNSQEIVKWLEQIWLDEEAQKLIDKDILLKFIESLKEDL